MFADAVFDLCYRTLTADPPRHSSHTCTRPAAEVTISAQFLDNFSGDNVRYLARSFGVPGDHTGQQSNGHRWVLQRLFPIELWSPS